MTEFLEELLPNDVDGEFSKKRRLKELEVAFTSWFSSARGAGRKAFNGGSFAPRQQRRVLNKRRGLRTQMLPPANSFWKAGDYEGAHWNSRDSSTGMGMS